MIIGRLKVNHLELPLGYDLGKPVFTWTVLESTGRRQKESRLIVCENAEMDNPVYDSGVRTDLDCLCTEVKLCLKPRTRYWWKVEVWADDGDYGVSPLAWFETGKLEEPWKAVWIKPSFDKSFHPLFHQEFNIGEEVRQARAYICGLGLYELFINGEKAGDEYLMPGYHDYARWLQYQSYDVTELVRKGENGLGVMLGNGWYKGRLGFVKDMDEVYGDEMIFLCELCITTVSGKELVIAGDESWLCHPGPVLESSIYNGESYDAGREVRGFSMAGLPTENWQTSLTAKRPDVPLKERLSLPLRIQERLKPAELLHTPAGELVLDFGQEITGWMEFPCSLPEGQSVFLQYGEILQDGNFYNENLRTAKAEFQYHADGRSVWVRPHFTYYGFRYVKAEGLSEEELMKAEGCVIHSDLERTGSVETSDPHINRLFLNALWGQKGNFLDVPTDCPQRDERLGWTGDAQVFAATATFNMDTAAFYRKYIYEMGLEQKDQGGAVPDVVPDTIGQIHMLRRDQGRSAGACAWGDAAAVIPWTMYLFYGDKSLLSSQFDSMCMWVDYIRRVDEEQCGSSRLWTCGFHYGDWLALDNPDPESRFGGTDNDYVASAYYYYSARLTAEAAQVLGKKKEAAEYGKLAGEVKEAFCRAFYTDRGEPVIQTQTALVMALYLGLMPEGDGGGGRIAGLLREKLQERKLHLDTGFVGTPWLCPALSLYGMKDAAYALLFQTDYPSWLYEVHMGATTIWERWNSVLPDGRISGTGMNSLNHYAYGSIVEWMYRYVCGINPVWSDPGFKRAVIRPQTDEKLTWARGRYLSPVGEYICRWERKDGSTVYDVKIPFEAEAEFIPDGAAGRAVVNGKRCEELEKEGSIMLEAGSWKIEVFLRAQE